MKAVLLDASTLGHGIDLSPIQHVVQELHVYDLTTPDQLKERIAGADILLVNKVVVPEWALSKSKGVFVLATGTNNIDLGAARKHGVPVFNVSNYGTDSVAQHTLMMILALAAQLPKYQKDLRLGEWESNGFFCLLSHSTVQLAGKRLLIVGEGDLGKKVAKLAQAFGMEVQFCARPGAMNDARPAFSELILTADVLSFHCPLTEYTRHLLNTENLKTIKPGCLVINCARGGMIDETAALAALRSERLGGLAVDVLPEEPPVKGHPLLEALNDRLNLIVTPHNAWISPEARQNIINLTAENIMKLKRV